MASLPPAHAGRTAWIAQARMFLFVLPALILVTGAFGWPIVLALSRSIDNSEVRNAFPATVVALGAWDGTGLPDMGAQAAFADDLVIAARARGLGPAGRRLGMEIPGFPALLQKTARVLVPQSTAPRENLPLAEVDPRWSEPRYWQALQRASRRLTDLYFLTAMDLQRDGTGAIAAMPEERSLYREVAARTFSIALLVTVLCLVIAYPVSYLIASLRQEAANRLLLLVLLPFWTSILVRTAAWTVLLQREGVINGALLGLGLIGTPLPLIFNRFGVVIALTQVLLPYMVLTLYSVMKGIDGRYVRAARSLGATPWQAFRRVYLPLTLPGIGAGSLLVFILAIGSYVTPALIGGRHDQMLSYYIAFNINQTINWGLAAALSVVLVVVVVGLYALYARMARLDRMRAG